MLTRLLLLGRAKADSSTSPVVGSESAAQASSASRVLSVGALRGQRQVAKIVWNRESCARALRRHRHARARARSRGRRAGCRRGCVDPGHQRTGQRPRGVLAKQVVERREGERLDFTRATASAPRSCPHRATGSPDRSENSQPIGVSVSRLSAKPSAVADAGSSHCTLSTATTSGAAPASFSSSVRSPTATQRCSSRPSPARPGAGRPRARGEPSGSAATTRSGPPRADRRALKRRAWPRPPRAGKKARERRAPRRGRRARAGRSSFRSPPRPRAPPRRNDRRKQAAARPPQARDHARLPPSPRPRASHTGGRGGPVSMARPVSCLLGQACRHRRHFRPGPWARLGSNQRPLACEATQGPLEHAIRA